MSESNLHQSIVKYIRDRHPQLLIDGGLGELQTDRRERIDAFEKGYTARKSDLLIFNHYGEWKGFAIEFKNTKGGGVLSEKQKSYLNQLKRIGWKTLVTNNYYQCRREIYNYVRNL